MALDPNRVDFDKSAFDALVENKGHIMERETAIRCSCNEKATGNPHSDCVNCNGIGFVFLTGDPIRGVISNMNYDPKTQRYHTIDMGTAMLTTRYENRVAFMDKLTIKDGESIFTETIYPVQQTLTGGGAVLRGRTLYAPISISSAFLFVDADTPHVELEETLDYTISGNIITFSEAIRQDLEDSRYDYAQIGVRYSHYPQYIVMDVLKDIRNTRELTIGGTEEVRKMINNCIIKKLQFIFAPQSMPDVIDEN